MSVRKVTGTLETGGGTFGLVTASCDFNFMQNAGTFRAQLAISDTDMNYWAKAAPIEITLKVMGKELFAGIVDNVVPNYGQGLVDIDGRDYTAKLIEKTTKDSFVNRKRSDVVQELAGRAGLGAVVSGGGGVVGDQAGKQWEQEHSNSISTGESLWSIIQRYAKIDNVLAYVEDRTLYYVSDAQAQGGSYSFNYKPPSPQGHATANAVDISFRRNLNLAKTLRVSINGWHTKQKKKLKGEATKPGQGGELLIEDHRANNLKNDGEAQSKAQSTLDELAEKEFAATVHVPGDPSMKRRGSMSISGTAFDGSYKLESIHHSLGWTTPYTTTLHGRRGR